MTEHRLIAHPRPGTDPGLWLTDAIVVTQNAKREAFQGSVLIRDSRIADLRRGPPPRRARARSLGGAALVPGFIQAHVHLCQTLFRNLADDLELLDWLSKRIWVMEAAHDEETLRASARLGIHELLSSGTTAALDMGTVRHTEEIFRAAEEAGIRANVGKCLMDHPGTTPPGLRERTRDALTEAMALAKAWHGRAGGRIRASFAPRFVVSCTEGLLTEVSRAAGEMGSLIHTHASENLKEIQLVKKLVGYENIEYLHELGLTGEHLVLAHCIWVKPQEMRILRSTGTRVVHCPSSNLKLASGIARVPEMRAKGIRVALGADGAPCNNNLDMFREMRLAALIHKPGSGPRAMRAQEVLDMATLEGAAALGQEGEIGSIEIGKRADLVAIDLSRPENQLAAPPRRGRADSDAVASSLVYSSGREHVRQVWVDGRLLVDAGRVRGLDTAAVARDAARARERIARRIGMRAGRPEVG